MPLAFQGLVNILKNEYFPQHLALDICINSLLTSALFFSQLMGGNLDGGGITHNYTITFEKSSITDWWIKAGVSL
jgi:hypothetical protein